MQRFCLIFLLAVICGTLGGCYAKYDMEVSVDPNVAESGPTYVFIVPEGETGTGIGAEMEAAEFMERAVANDLAINVDFVWDHIFERGQGASIYIPSSDGIWRQWHVAGAEKLYIFANGIGMEQAKKQSIPLQNRRVSGFKVDVERSQIRVVAISKSKQQDPPPTDSGD